ncbi:primosomal protein N' [Oceanispirochaeta sp.]|jgi:primosomal protein N' (replication factor Y)|uniref:replication restart helicase PriA n=1 Tax=Oceanispirochaeta sp. TaxID=2035350 RepID=UPI002610B86E|nr:primosomal protein N' [Oceanispirochaeta sp.]MDA3955746.1 primosomal protein N' [Oceanispirochaeta sp.]
MGTEYLEVVFNLPLKSCFSYSHPEGEERSASNLVGCRVSAPFGRRNLNGWVVSAGTVLPEGVKEAKPVFKILDQQPLFDQNLLELARWIADFYLCSLGEALSIMLPGGKREKELPPLGLGGVEEQHKRVLLSAEQEDARQKISKSNESFHYLYGITGSGKTEVFLRVAEEVLSQGKTVLFLVPEISLTHQMVDDLSGRFDKKPAVLHSHLTPSQKLTEWRRIQSGDAVLVLGARSAVFAPLKNLGLIILDEEHETSYKSGSTPRYHGRQVAMKRCRSSGAKLLMGSATPSVESWSMMEQGVFQRHQLKERPAGGALPDIRIIDLKKSGSLLSQDLIQAMERVLKEGKQVILFLNRRGHSYYFHCRSCGFEMKCRQCSIPLTFHKNRNRMICHYCGFHEKPLTLCPECGSMDVGYAGFGTEQVEEQVAAVFPDAVMARLDTDSARKKGVLQDTISRFRDGGIDILLGTQMVAKGLNFPGVKLVGIVLADTGLSLPDFRAAERSFSLIVQVAGRAGRYRNDGEVLVQTMRPDNPAIVYGCEGRIEEFYQFELNQRKEMNFPPFSRLIRIVYRGKQGKKVLDALEDLSDLFRKAGLPDVMGPAECPLGIIAGNYRYHTLIRCEEDFSGIHKITASCLSRTDVPRGMYREIDIDPVQLL